MIVAVADTHAVIWNLFDDKRLSPNARKFMDDAEATGNQIALSSITLAEIVYLSERSRIPVDTLAQLLLVLNQPASALIEIPFDRVIAQQLTHIARTAVPELPDRIIAATALSLSAPIISRDYAITVSGIKTIW
jgi:PIN domain nuclease of toxin-antitoxin system